MNIKDKTKINDVLKSIKNHLYSDIKAVGIEDRYFDFIKELSKITDFK